jgi:calcium-dependent protein kinase
VSAEAKDLVQKLLTYNPEKRINALNAVNHPWIKKMSTAEKISQSVARNTLKNLKNFRVSSFFF